MKTLAVLLALAGAAYFGWQRYERWRDTAPNVSWSAEQLGQAVDELYLVFGANTLDGRVLELDGPAGANLLVMTGRMGHHFFKSNPDLVINCRTPGVRDMVNALGGMILVSDNPRGQRELDRMVATFKERAKAGGKRPCLKLEGNELRDPRFNFGGPIPGKLVKVRSFQALDCGDLIAGM
jgi:hypothetical protein